MLEVAHEHLLSPLTLAQALTADQDKPLLAPRHLSLLSDELVQLWRREKGWPRKLMVFMPPRHAKSTTCSHWFPVWQLALDPSTKILFASYEAEFAKKWGRDTRRTIAEMLPVLGVRIMEDSKAAHRWETSKHGGMQTAGRGGSFSGKGCDCLLIDDPLSNAEEANSKTVKDSLWDWWVTTALTRLDDPNAICVLIQTRWAPDDLAGRILASESADKWRVLCLPALAEGDDDPLGRSEGKALWPEKFDEEHLLSLKQQMGSGPFAALYQQRPAPAEGFAVNPEWWQWYDKAPPPEAFDEIIQSWDTTFDDAASSDYVCGGTVGRRGADYFVLDCIHRRLNTPDTIRAIRTMSERWPDARRKLLEKAASATSIFQMLAHEVTGLALIPPQGSKTVRLHWGVSSCSGLIENKRVWLPRAAGWARELVAEFRDFPNAANDDYVDMLTQALTHLMPHGWSWERQDLAAKANGPAKTAMELHTRQLWSSIRKQMAAYANRHEDESDADEYGI